MRYHPQLPRLSRITADVGTDPANIRDGVNEFTFSDATTGVLILPFKVRLPGIVDQSAADQAKYTFSVDAIGSSTLTWDTAGGQATVSGEYLLATATFTGLPQNNSDFGSKTVRLKFNGSEVANAKFEAFFMRDKTNHPGAGAGTNPNWFYYWGQTTAKFGTPEYQNGVSAGYTDFILGAWRSFLQDGTTGHTLGGTWNNAEGNDLYANVARHEETHKTQLIDIWGAASGRVAADDLDGDVLRDSIEVILIPGHPYSPSNAYTYSDEFNYNAAPGGVLRDSEDYCLRQQPAWTNGSANLEDWSNPGMQHKTLNDSDD